MTMLLVNNPQEVQSHAYYMSYRTPSAPTVLNILSMPPQHNQHHHQQTSMSSPAYDNEVAQALEIARESPDGAKDPTVSNILETALAQIWAKVQAKPNSYVMTRDEFAVFNYFQHRFQSNETADSARRRYWDNTKGA
ncbi:hypothetical protein BKA67DRAFT_534675 [Truncatella angustata]|uniref:Uncharacterized protein n=1 Tax=Truncatella angustata TaxID=152316 RepID=A0A9P8UPN1_9PEZI|nr:uncharacterized protein BKA67DRAFT_534675 [Truncatella angustata]KAH6655759.1 hypothetical protein BKA67DRAFT_534675 [Truncatella angustata]KAH8200104.1 hypothetical protein TruAng_005725 [Truncatella angustata]